MNAKERLGDELLFTRGAFLEQKKEPALSSDIELFDTPDYVYIPLAKERKHVTERNFNTSTLSPLYIPANPEEAKVYPGIGGFYKEDVSMLGPDGIPRSYARINLIDHLPLKNQPAFPMYNLTADDIISLAYEYGVRDEIDGVSLHVKLRKMRESHVSTVIGDAMEDEPLASSRTALVIQRTDEVVKGLELAQKAVGAADSEVWVYGEMGDIRSKIPRQYRETTFRRPSIPYPARYNLITKGKAKENQFIGVGALYHLYRAVAYHRPQNTCFLTIGGDCIAAPVNVEAPLGTPLHQLLVFGGISEEPARVVMGGAMTGVCVDNLTLPIGYTTGSLYAFYDRAPSRYLECCGCGKCVNICPAGLLPYALYKNSRSGQWEACDRFGVKDCLECGLCSYICASRVDLMTYIKNAKQALKGGDSL